MNISSANLKHLYQKRSFWFLGLVFGFIAWMMTWAVTKNYQGVLSVPVLWMLFVGTFMAALPIDVLTKPFSYCLPNHRSIPAKFLFLVGLPLSFLWSLMFIFFPDLTVLQTILACLSAGSTFTIFYWVGAWLVSKYKNWGITFAFIPLIMLANQWLNISAFLVHTMVQSPLPMIGLGGIVNVLAWRYWSRPDLARQYCGIFWMGAFDAWNMEKLAKFKQARLAEKEKKRPNKNNLSLRVEEFFVSRISRPQTGSIKQYIWGALYKTFGMSLSQYRQDWLRFLMLMLPILMFLCYMPGEGKTVIFLMPGIMVIHINLWVYSSLLISGGRRQRFWSALTLAVTTGILTTVAVAILAMTTQWMERIMPPLTAKGHEFVFDAVNMKFSALPLLMIPVTLAIGLIFYKKNILAMILSIVIFQIFFFCSLVDNLKIMNVPIQITYLHVLMMLPFSWLLFVAVLRRISMRCCLVKQSK